jgi:hypothetical protein
MLSDEQQAASLAYSPGERHAHEFSLVCVCACMCVFKCVHERECLFFCGDI